MPPKRFRTLGTPTAPSADDSNPPPQPPERLDVKTSERAKPARIAFTWRLTPDEANRLDALVLRLRSELGVARLDRATVLSVLCHLADSNQAVYGAALAELSDA